MTITILRRFHRRVKIDYRRVDLLYNCAKGGRVDPAKDVMIRFEHYKKKTNRKTAG